MVSSLSSYVLRPGSELSRSLQQEWSAYGGHRAPADPVRDQAWLHVDGTHEHRDIIALLDALSTPQRQVQVRGRNEPQPVFDITLAVR